MLWALGQVDPLAREVALRWDLLLGAASFFLIYLVLRTRAELADSMGFRPADVALLTFGSVAAQPLSVPLAIVGGAVFAVNLGGALVPLLIVVRLIRRGTLSITTTLVGTAVVALVTWFAVDVDPARGIVAGYPRFFWPPAAALAVAGVVALGSPTRAGAAAFATGSLGVLIGADVLLLPEFIDVGRAAAPGTALVIGGAGALDLVVLSGALGLAVSMLVATLVVRGPGRRIADPRARAVRVGDADHVERAVQHLGAVSPRELSLVHVGRANNALASRDHQRCLKEARAALDVLLRSGRPRLLERLRASRADDDVRAVLRQITAQLRAAEHSEPEPLVVADTLELVKRTVGQLWHAVPGDVRIQGGRP